MLSRYNRFHGHGSLRYVYKNADAFRSRLMTLKVIANPHRKTSRCSIVVSKKVHKSAVGRNRIRRRLYEIVRAELPLIDKAYDIVLIVISGEALMASHEELQMTVHELFDQARIKQ